MVRAGSGAEPNRSRAVLGLARAAAKAGDRAKSLAAYRQLLANWKQADADLPELREARAAVARPTTRERAY